MKGKTSAAAYIPVSLFVFIVRPGSPANRSQTLQFLDPAACPELRRRADGRFSHSLPKHIRLNPVEMGEAEIAQFLSSLASDAHVSASTQNQALNALLFLYKEILEKKIGLIQGVVRAKKPIRVPVGLTKEEVKSLTA